MKSSAECISHFLYAHVWVFVGVLIHMKEIQIKTWNCSKITAPQTVLKISPQGAAEIRANINGWSKDAGYDEKQAYVTKSFICCAGSQHLWWAGVLSDKILTHLPSLHLPPPFSLLLCFSWLHSAMPDSWSASTLRKSATKRKIETPPWCHVSVPLM